MESKFWNRVELDPGRLDPEGSTPWYVDLKALVAEVHLVLGASGSRGGSGIVKDQKPGICEKTCCPGKMSDI